jgi:hypothetical protein
MCHIIGLLSFVHEIVYKIQNCSFVPNNDGKSWLLW